MVPGKEMEDHFGEVDVGDKYYIHRTVDDVIYHLWVMKEPNYVMRMMATDGSLLEDGIYKETVRTWKVKGEDVMKKLDYKLPFDWNYRYHHAVDNHVLTAV